MMYTGVVIPDPPSAPRPTPTVIPECFYRESRVVVWKSDLAKRAWKCWLNEQGNSAWRDL